MDRIVVFETFYNPIEANIVKARLLDSGIQCFLSDENTITINPLYTQALGGVKLHLFERDVAAAAALIQDEGVEVALSESQEDQRDSSDATNQDRPICPVCGASNVGYVQAAKKRFGIFTMIVSLILMVYPFYAKKVYHCFDCQNEFK